VAPPSAAGPAPALPPGAHRPPAGAGAAAGNGQPASAAPEPSADAASLGAAARALIDPAVPLASRAPAVAALLRGLESSSGHAAEALLAAGPRGAADACHAAMVSGSTPAALKLQAADLLAAICGDPT
jgi:hypothetical protein